ncbi:MAG TPA: helix-turn-helix transcriptional regulator [Rhodocyclaceae bacterium]|nr:helix-turn-helix transcriptional regulator [Rhodocyclaceae bacterium]
MSIEYGEEIFNIGRRLKEERERIGLSQELFGSKICTTGRTIKKYEIDETSPRATELLRMHGMGVDVLYVITGTRLPIGVASPEAIYTPAESLGQFIRSLKLSDDDAELLRAMADRLAR